METRDRRNAAISAWTRYIDALPEWQRDVARQGPAPGARSRPGRGGGHQTCPKPYFVLHGNICALLGVKDHLNVFIYDPVATEPHGLMNQGRANATARGIQIRRDDHVDEAALLDLLLAP